MAFALTALGAALACAVEMLEALAIVLAVAVTRRPREATAGAAAALALCLALAVLIGPALLERIALAPLRLVIGVALLLFGLEWMRKAVLRLAGRRARSDSFQEFLDEQDELEAVAAPVPGRFDWPGATLAFKGVLIEGVEVILIVTALSERPGGRTPAVIGAAGAAVLVAGAGALLHRPLRRVPETELKYLVGILLSTFGTFFCAEGLDVRWPLGDAALPVIAVLWLAISQALVRRLTRHVSAAWAS